MKGMEGEDRISGRGVGVANEHVNELLSMMSKINDESYQGLRRNHKEDRIFPNTSTISG